jgi:serine protease AprX
MPEFTPNYPYFADGLLSVPERLNAPAEYSGRGIVIAFVDAGFSMHDDIRDRVLIHADATTSRIKEEKMVSHVDVTSWHGLMVSAIAAGNGALSGGRYRGLAHESQLVLIKVSNPRMQVKEADILRGFKWLIKNHAQFGVHIANVSVGGDHVSKDPEHPLHRAAAELVEAGVVVVIASGNRGDKVLVPPASSPEAIIVGGYDDQNRLDPATWQAYHSSYGTAYDGTLNPDIIAPAQWIPSPILPGTVVETEARWLGPLLDDPDDEALEGLLKTGYADLKLTRKRVRKPDEALYQTLQERIHAHKLINAHYQHVDGTSVAAPIVSSLIAQMLEVNPDLQPEQVRTILRQTAVPVAGISMQQQGAGAINPGGALETARHLRVNAGQLLK